MSRSVKRNQTLLLLGFCCLTVGVFIGLSVSRFGFLSKCGVDALRASVGAPPQLAHCSKYVRPGTETLAPGIVEAYTDLFLRRLWGNPDEDIPYKARYLLVLTVGIQQKEMVNKAVSKFNKDFLIVLFHYDGHVDGWDEYEWSQRAVHYAARKQTKWWYAKRFLHPDVVRDYEYIFLWDEDLDLEHFDPLAYLDIVKKHGLEISQPGLEDTGLTWKMTKRIGGSEVHKQTSEERPDWCGEGPQKPPCAAFVEIMAPVFSRTAWRCVWHLVQNDLVHGWGLDFSLQKCVTPAHEKIGVVDAQWIRHQGVPSLGNQGEATDGNEPWRGVRTRCRLEWKMFADRLHNAEETAKNMTTAAAATATGVTTTGTNNR